MNESADTRGKFASTASSAEYRGLDWSLHNPGLLDRQTLIERFLFRHELLAELVSQLRKQPGGYGLRHLICIGQRGMGKTTLLRRLSYAIEDDAGLSARWQPILFNEEQYNVGDLADLFTETLRLIAESTGDRLASTKLPASAAKQTTGENTEAADLAEHLYVELVSFCQRVGRRLVLLIDNINELLQVLSSEESNRLREILMTQPHILIIGAAPTHFSEIGDYQKPFYQFFRTYRLEGLSEQDMEAFLLALAKHNNDNGVLSVLQQHPERVRSLRQLTGGNPRIALYLYRLLSESPHGEIRRDLERLIDEVTPFYKHRLDSLEPLARKVFDAIARHWHPVTASQLASSLRMTEDAVAEPLRRLRDSSHVEELFEGGDPLRFQISERMCNIYYLMRFSRGGRQRLQWLVLFLRAFYDPETLQALAGKWVVTWEKAPLTPQKAGERTASLFLIAQALTSADAQTAVLLRAIDFAERGKVTGEDMSRILLDVMQDHAGEKSSALSAAVGTLLRVMSDGEVSDKKRLILEQIVTSQPDSFFAWRLLGRQYHRRRQHPEALQAAERLVALHPERADAWLQLAECATQSKDKERAQSALAQAHRLNPSGDRPAAHELVLLLECGDPLEAERRLTVALAEHPEQPALWALRARLDEIRGEISQALVAARRAAALLPDFAPYWHNIVLLSEKLGLLDEAFSAAKQAVAVDPYFGEARAMLGMLLAKRGEFAKSIAETQRAVENDPHLGFAWSNLSGLLLQENRLEEAARAGARATEVDPTNVHGWNHLGASLMRLGRHEEAEAAFARALALPGSQSAVRPNRGWMYLRQARWTEALTDFELAVNDPPVKGMTLYGLCMALLGLNQAVRALKVAMDALQLDAELPELLWGTLAVSQQQLGNSLAMNESAATAIALCANDAQRLVRLGNDYLILSAHDLALAVFDRALAIDSRNTEALGNRAVVLMHQKRWQEADAVLRQLVEQAPDLAAAWHNLAITGRQINDPQAAIAALQRLTELEPSRISEWAQLGALCIQTGNIQLAQTSFERVLALDATREDALQHLGLIALTRKDHAQARYFAERLAAARPDVVPTLQLQAMVALAHGQLEEGLRATRRCTELMPEQAALWHNLASLYATLQKPQEALEAMEQAVRRTPYPQNWFNLATSSLNAKEFDRAARAFAEIRSIESANKADVESAIGAAYAQAERLTDAHVALTRAVELNPAHPIAWFNLSMVELGLDHPEAALSAFAAGLGVNRTGATIAQWLQLANRTWAAENADRLLALLAEGTAQYPDQLVLWLTYAWLASYAKKFELAEQALGHARNLAPEEPSVFATEATLALARGDLAATLAGAKHVAQVADVAWIDNNLPHFYALLLGLALSGATAPVLALVAGASHLQLTERLLPFYAALDALCSSDSERLQSLAPEVRESAHQLLQLLMAPQAVGGRAERLPSELQLRCGDNCAPAPTKQG